MAALQELLQKSSYFNNSIIQIVKSIANAGKQIAEHLQAADLREGFGNKLGMHNTHGEQVAALDVLSHDTVMQELKQHCKIRSVISEEAEQEVFLNLSGHYRVAIDPLDGSSNIQHNIPTGTIFGIYEFSGKALKAKDLMAAGYIMYGPATLLTISDGFSCHTFTLHPVAKQFVLTSYNHKSPNSGSIYSFNNALLGESPITRNYLKVLRNSKRYTSRYVGSLVADFHRNLSTGGVFMYPKTDKNPHGKLRLFYEALPLSFIAKAAGGSALVDWHEPMDATSDNIHQKCDLVIGSRTEVRQFTELLDQVPNIRKVA